MASSDRITAPAPKWPTSAPIIANPASARMIGRNFMLVGGAENARPRGSLCGRSRTAECPPWPPDTRGRTSPPRRSPPRLLCTTGSGEEERRRSDLRFHRSPLFELGLVTDRSTPAAISSRSPGCVRCYDGWRRRSRRRRRRSPGAASSIARNGADQRPPRGLEPLPRAARVLRHSMVEAHSLAGEGHNPEVGNNCAY